jgi:disulfide bond formation protein DsbB
MNRTKAALFAIFLACSGMLAVAMYLQIVLDMLPCPYCVLQRYAFTLIGLAALLALVFPKKQRFAMGGGLLFSLIGAGLSSYQLWLIAQPPGSCGIEKMSGPINNFFVAKLFPIMFKANGLCETPYDPILGLSIPAWALVWFFIFAVATISLFFSKKKERVFFGKIRQ